MVKRGTELQELLALCDAVPTQLDRFDVAVRTAMRELNDLLSVVATLRKEAGDTEFEDVRPDLRAFIDGSLLNRIGFVDSRAGMTVPLLRQLGDGLRQLRGDAGQLLAMERRVPTGGNPP